MQDQPDQPTLSMRDGSDGLWVSETWYCAAIDNLEDASFRFDSGVGRPVEKAPHVTVALRRSVGVVDAALSSSPGQAPTHEERDFPEGKSLRWDRLRQ